MKQRDQREFTQVRMNSCLLMLSHPVQLAVIGDREYFGRHAVDQYVYLMI